MWVDVNDVHILSYSPLTGFVALLYSITTQMSLHVCDEMWVDVNDVHILSYSPLTGFVALLYSITTQIFFDFSVAEDL